MTDTFKTELINEVFFKDYFNYLKEQDLKNNTDKALSLLIKKSLFCSGFCETTGRPCENK